MNDIELNDGLNDDAQLEARLSDLLHRRGAHLGVHGAGPGAARRRARARRDRGRAVMAGGTAAVVLGSVATVWWSRGPDNDTVRVVQGSESDVGGAGQLEWSLVDQLDIGEGNGLSRTGAVTDSQGVQYVLSTQPGAAPADSRGMPDVRSTLYASSDGRSWTPRGAEDEYSLRGLAIRGDELYTVGTAASTRAQVGDRHRPGNAVIRRSSDGGLSWTDVTLPIDFEAIADAGASVFASADIAVAGDRVVAIVQWTTMPGAEQLTRLLGNQADNGWNATPAGVEVYEPMPDGAEKTDGPRKVARTLSWAELGIDPTDALGTRVFTSEDGKTFTAVETPFGADSVVGYDPSVVAVDGGLLASVAVPSGPSSEYVPRLYRSTDGLTWAPVATTGLSGAGDLSVLGSDVVMAGYGQNGSFLARSTDGGTSWSNVDLVGIARSLGIDTPTLQASSFAVDESGFVAILDEPLEAQRLDAGKAEAAKRASDPPPATDPSGEAAPEALETEPHPASILWTSDGSHWGVLSAAQVSGLTGGLELDYAPRIVSDRVYVRLTDGTPAPGERHYLTAVLPN